MSFLDLAKRRQSCRKYDLKVVPKESIERCLEAARMSPSACNSQPWKFIVVQEPELKEKLAQHAFGGIYSIFDFAKQAPVLVAVVREHQKYTAKLGGFFRGIQYALIDIGIACEHFILQAEEEGLGSCWIGWFNERGAKRALGLDKRKKVDIIIALGYAEDKTVREKNRKSLEEMSKIY